MVGDSIALLQQMSVFGGVRAEVLELVLRQSRTVSAVPGSYLVREGDPAESMFVLLSGTAAVTQRTSAGEATRRVLHAGECFGEMSLMDLSPRSASVRALEECTALEVSAACLLEVYAHDVEQFAIIEMNMGREASRRLRDVEARTRGVPR
jgi:CRP-like cAMP-binding protein